MSVVGFPGREEHREGWDECCKSTSSSCAETHRCSFEKAAEGTVQRVYAVANGDCDQLIRTRQRRAECHSSIAQAFCHLSEARTYSNSSPSPLDVPVLLACFPSMLSIVE